MQRNAAEKAIRTPIWAFERHLNAFQTSFARKLSAVSNLAMQNLFKIDLHGFEAAEIGFLHMPVGRLVTKRFFTQMDAHSRKLLICFQHRPTLIGGRRKKGTTSLRLLGYKQHLNERDFLICRHSNFVALSVCVCVHVLDDPNKDESQHVCTEGERFRWVRKH